MRMKTAQILMECLLEQGVDTVFGYPRRHDPERIRRI